MAFLADQLILIPSRTLQWVLVPVYGAALVAPFFSRLPLSLCAVLALLLFWHGRFVFRRDVWLRTPDAVVAVRWDARNCWFMTLGDGREVAVVPGPRTLLLARLSLLELRPVAGGGVRRVPVLADSGDPDVIRRLRVRLRFGGAGGVIS